MPAASRIVAVIAGCEWPRIELVWPEREVDQLAAVARVEQAALGALDDRRHPGRVVTDDVTIDVGPERRVQPGLGKHAHGAEGTAGNREGPATFSALAVQSSCTVLDPRRLRLLIQLQSLGTVRAVAARRLDEPVRRVSSSSRRWSARAAPRCIERHGRTVALTDAGVALAGHARVILERIDAAEEGAARAPGRARRRGARLRVHQRDARVRDRRGGGGRTTAPRHQRSSSPSSSRRRTSRRSNGARSTSRSSPTSGTAPSRTRRTCARCRSRATSCSSCSRRARPPAVTSKTSKTPPGSSTAPELEQHIVRRCRRAGFEPRFAGRVVQPRVAAVRRPPRAGRDDPAVVRRGAARHGRAWPAQPRRAPRAAGPAPRGGADAALRRAHARRPVAAAYSTGGVP